METEDLDLYDPDEKEDFFVVVEEMPQLIGGLQSIQTQIRYPEMARRAGIEGRVFIQFIVNEEGEVEHPRVMRGIGGGADEEALRVVSQANFTPGMQRGRPVRVQYSLPIYFRISESGAETSSVESPTVMQKTMAIQWDRSGDVISGKVLDENSNRPLSGASVIVDGSNRGSVTDMNGNFSLSNIQSLEPLIVISYVGYETARLEL
jgi:TonB family protein